jgi:flavodoxin
MKSKKYEEDAKKLYKEITGIQLIDKPVSCPNCHKMDYEYNGEAHGVFCKCGFGVREKDLIHWIWGIENLLSISQLKERANFYCYGLMNQKAGQKKVKKN